MHSYVNQPRVLPTDTTTDTAENFSTWMNNAAFLVYPITLLDGGPGCVIHDSRYVMNQLFNRRLGRQQYDLILLDSLS